MEDMEFVLVKICSNQVKLPVVGVGYQICHKTFDLKHIRPARYAVTLVDQTFLERANQYLF